MGPEKLIINHNIMLQLWDEPKFWELFPELEDTRPAAESLAEQSRLAKNSLGVKGSDLYNEWQSMLELWAITKPDILDRLVSYIRSKRKNQAEGIALPSGTDLTKGVFG